MTDNKWCRRHYALLFNKFTREYVTVDLFEKRLSMMRRRLYTWCNVMTVYCTKNNFDKLMLGFTYKPGCHYEPGHMRSYLKKIKQMLGEDLKAFAWVAELQARGEVHYHLMLVVSKGVKVPLPDKSGMWGFGSSNVQRARTFYYLVSYIGKEYQKDLSKYPKHCRLYGASIRFDKAASELFREASGIKNDGEYYESAYEFVGACVTEGYLEVLKNSCNTV